MDWRDGLEGWTGGIDWRDGLEGWTGGMDWRDGLEGWIGGMDWRDGLKGWTGGWTGSLVSCTTALQSSFCRICGNVISLTCYMCIIPVIRETY